MISPKGVLVVDDDKQQRQRYVDELEGRNLNVWPAATLPVAEDLYRLNRDAIGGIILDGCVPGDEVNTIPFIKMVLGSGFRGVLVAASDLQEDREKMQRAGCTHRIQKDQAAALVATQLLGY